MADSVPKQTAPLLVVAAALIDPHGRVLVQQRPPGKSMAGLWEFPGGKIEPGETPEAGLVRELQEELGITVALTDCPGGLFVTTTVNDLPLVLLLYMCPTWAGKVEALHATSLRWCHLEELATLAMPPADVPLVDMLARIMGPATTPSSLQA